MQIKFEANWDAYLEGDAVEIPQGLARRLIAQGLAVKKPRPKAAKPVGESTSSKKHKAAEKAVPRGRK